MSRRIAIELYDEIIKLKPEWHSDDLNKGVIKSGDDGFIIGRPQTRQTPRHQAAAQSLGELYVVCS
jgi:type I restriction enzyme R subunit